MFEFAKSCMRKFYCPNVDCKDCKNVLRKLGHLSPKIKEFINQEAGSCNPGGKDWPYEEPYESGGFNSFPLLGVTHHDNGDSTTMNRANELGCNVVRTDLIYEAYDVGMKNSVLNYVKAARNYGMRSMLVMGMGANNPDPSWPSKPKPNDPNYISVYLEFLDRFSADFGVYKSNVIPQILNEYNTDTFYDVSVDRYMEILGAAYDKLKSNGFPQVVMGGIVGWDKDKGTQADYISQLMNKGLVNKTDAFCIHWYYGDNLNYSWAFIDGLKTARQMGFNKFIYVTEFAELSGLQGDQIKIQVFDNMFRKCFKEWGVNLALWYCLKAGTQWDLLNPDNSPTAAYNYIKNNHS